MIRWIPIAVSLCVVSMVTELAFADDAENTLEGVLEEIRHLKSQMQRIEKEIGSLRRRLDKLETKEADSSSGAAHSNDERSLRRVLPFSHPRESVDEVLRLQFRAPSYLLEGIHEREEGLRRRPFPVELYSRPMRN